MASPPNRITDPSASVEQASGTSISTVIVVSSGGITNDWDTSTGCPRHVGLSDLLEEPQAYARAPGYQTESET